jgi:hypothetical protein
LLFSKSNRAGETLPTAPNNMKYIETHQIPKGGISPDIFNLPCVNCAYKHKTKGVEYSLIVSMLHDYTSVSYAYPTDWLCLDEFGAWHVINDGVYKKRAK